MCFFFGQTEANPSNRNKNYVGLFFSFEFRRIKIIMKEVIDLSWDVVGLLNMPLICDCTFTVVYLVCLYVKRCMNCSCILSRSFHLNTQILFLCLLFIKWSLYLTVRENDWSKLILIWNLFTSRMIPHLRNKVAYLPWQFHTLY